VKRISLPLQLGKLCFRSKHIFLFAGELNIEWKRTEKIYGEDEKAWDEVADIYRFNIIGKYCYCSYVPQKIQANIVLLCNTWGTYAILGYYYGIVTSWGEGDQNAMTRQCWLAMVYEGRSTLNSILIY